jgi:hypothetical protein
MALTAGTISLVQSLASSLSLVCTAATSGTAPYTYQWYMSTSNGFTPDSTNLIAGATSLSLTVQNLVPRSTYFFRLIVTDSAGTPATATTAQFTTGTDLPVLSQNAYQQTPFVGMLDLKVGPANVVTAIIASNGISGNAVVLTNTSSSLPVVTLAQVDSNVFGFVAYNIKNQSHVGGSVVEIAQAGSCIWLYAGAAIDRGARVELDPSCDAKFAVQPFRPAGASNVIGYAYDQATAEGQLIRVMLTTPSFVFGGGA